MLLDLGYRVFTAGDAAAALGILERDSRISLLFTDIGEKVRQVLGVS